MGINTSSSPPLMSVCFSFIASKPVIESVVDATEDREVLLPKTDLGGARVPENVVEAADQGVASAGDMGVLG
jgi:hypothetical protein